MQAVGLAARPSASVEAARAAEVQVHKAQTDVSHAFPFRPQDPGDDDRCLLHPAAVAALRLDALRLRGGGSTAASPGPGAAADPAAQELQRQSIGWAREPSAPVGVQRPVLSNAPALWTRGALAVMHGGGGSHIEFCVANLASIAGQLRFTEVALTQGFAVFLIDSSDQVSDNEGRICGKVWDDDVRARTNLDLPFIEDLLRRVVPAKRVLGSRSEVFPAGHSSGG